MELAMTNGFMELNQNEMEMVEGGGAKELVDFIGAIAGIGAAIYGAGYAVGTAFYYATNYTR